MKALLNFIFGKEPDIFDENGQVRHKLPDGKWNDWNSRYKEASHNWRTHKGATATKRSSLKSRKSDH